MLYNSGMDVCGRIGDLDQLAGGLLGLGKRAVSGEFIGSISSISKNFDISHIDGKTRGFSQACIDVWDD